MCLGGSALQYGMMSAHPDHNDIMLEFARKINKEKEAIEDMGLFVQSVEPELILEHVKSLDFYVNTFETVFSPVIESMNRQL